MSKKHKAAKDKAPKDKASKDKAPKDKAATEKTGKEKKIKAGAAATRREQELSPADSSRGDAATSSTSQRIAEAPKSTEPSGKVSASLTDRQVTVISKALADPTRMAVLRSIAKGGATCSGLRECAGVSAATLSHHMKELEAAGLIETERNGKFLSVVFQRRTWKNYVEELKALSK